MKTIELPDDIYDKLMALSKELQVQDNNCQGGIPFWTPSSMKHIPCYEGQGDTHFYCESPLIGESIEEVKDQEYDDRTYWEAFVSEYIKEWEYNDDYIDFIGLSQGYNHSYELEDVWYFRGDGEGKFEKFSDSAKPEIVENYINACTAQINLAKQYLKSLQKEEPKELKCDNLERALGHGCNFYNLGVCMNGFTCEGKPNE